VRTVQASGLAGDRWFVIEHGQVCLHPAGDDVGQAPRELGPGDCFGEGALLDGVCLPLAVALSDVQCRVLCRKDFLPAQAADGVGQQTYQLSRSFRPFPWVGQRDQADCGVAALGMVARHFERDVSQETLRGLVRVGAHGASLLELRQAAQRLGLPCQAVRIGAGQLRQVTPPAIAHLANGHFIVLFHISPQGAVVGDPATGVISMSADLLRQSCSGCLLVFAPTLPCLPQEPRP
jgi:predicted double-glycine peptidase